MTKYIKEACNHSPVCEEPANCRQQLEAAKPNTWHIRGFRNGIAEQFSYASNRNDAEIQAREYARLEGIDRITLEFNGKHIADYDFVPTKTGKHSWKWNQRNSPERVSTKTVFTNHEIFHAWAHQTSAEGRTADRKGGRGMYGYSSGGISVSFDGPVLYSYRMPIAQLVSIEGQQTYVLITSEKVTPTTNGHVSDARSATRQWAQLSVPYVDALPSDEYAWNVQHGQNILYFEEKMKQAYDKAKKSKARAHASYVEYKRWFDAAWEYRRVTLCHAVPIGPISGNELDEALEQSKPAYDAYQTKMHEAQTKAYETRWAMKQIKHGLGWSVGREEVKRIRSLSKKERDAEIARIMPRLQEERARIEAEQAEKRRLELIENAEKEKERIASWRAGGDWSYQLRNVPTMLRIKGDLVETSQGVNFPVSHALLAWKLLRTLVINSDGDANTIIWQRNGHSIKLGHYQIDRIMGNGTIFAGCHTIAWSEIERLALELGVA